MLIVYVSVESEDRVVVVTIQDARSSTSATCATRRSTRRSGHRPARELFDRA